MQHNNNNNKKNITSMGARARKRKKTINQIQEPGTYRGHHQYEGTPTYGGKAILKK